MELFPVAGIGIAQHAADFVIKRVVGRSLRCRVHLQLLHGRISSRAERGHQGAVCEVPGKHAPGKQDYAERRHLRTIPRQAVKRTESCVAIESFGCIANNMIPSDQPKSKGRRLSDAKRLSRRRTDAGADASAPVPARLTTSG